ncbi:MAG: protein kinase [Terriglobia bacterium]|jgi:serine/threonine-protein kinase
MSFQVGDKIGDYQIIGVLGAGGMGRVYKVKNMISDRVDAMKVLLPDLANEPDLADRFVREIKVLASLNHPNIAGLHTALRLQNQLLMIMEFVDGATLEDKLRNGLFPLHDAIDYVSQVLSALGYAHSHGVIHRDIKPANMMLTSENVIKLMDFGIAKSKTDRKLTMTGTTLGSLYYMPPEQVQGTDLDPRSDLYSVGVSLYEMVTGSRPFKGNSDYDLMVAQLQKAPLPPINIQPGLPKALNDIIMISLEKDPAKRFQSAEAFRFALQSVKGGLTSLPIASAQAVMPGLAGQPATPSAALSATGVLGAYPGQLAGAQLQPTKPSQAAMPPSQPRVVPPPATSRSYRGLYMTVGALVVIVVVALGAMQLPRLFKAKAGGAKQAAPAEKPPEKSTEMPKMTPQEEGLPKAGDNFPSSAESPNTPKAGGPGAPAAPALTAAPADHNLPTETAQATVPSPPNPTPRGVARPTAPALSRPMASPQPGVTAYAAKSLPAPPSLPRNPAPAAAISHPPTLSLDPAGRLLIVLSLVSPKPDGSFQFHGTLLLPVAQPGPIPLDRGAEVIGVGSRSQGRTSLAVTDLIIQGVRYTLKDGRGVMNAHTPGAGGRVDFDRSQLLDMWPTATAVYEKASDQTGQPESQK